MAISGNTTRPANARTKPKPAPLSAESIRRQVDDLKTATGLLKAVQAVEKAAAEPPFGSAESIRLHTDELKSDIALLKVVQAVEKAAAEPKEASAIAKDTCIESKIYDVRVWASTARELWAETRWSDQLTGEDHLAMSRIDRLIEKVNDVAEELYALVGTER
jgi:hypothetical protein